MQKGGPDRARYALMLSYSKLMSTRSWVELDPRVPSLAKEKFAERHQVTSILEAEMLEAEPGSFHFMELVCINI